MTNYIFDRPEWTVDNWNAISYEKTGAKLKIDEIRSQTGFKAARRRGRVGGRPISINEAGLKKARMLLRSGDYTKVQVAEESRFTLSRALSQEAIN